VPNREVNLISLKAFSRTLHALLKRGRTETEGYFINAVKGLDAGGLTRLFATFFESVPARHHENTETCYHKLVHGFLYDPDFRMVMSEPPSAGGTPDLVVFYPRHRLYVIIEIKFPEGRQIPAKEARGQEGEGDAARGQEGEGVEVWITREDAEKDCLKEERLLSRLAHKALEASRKKRYGLAYEAQAERIVRIGLGVIWRGKCLALAEEYEIGTSRSSRDPHGNPSSGSGDL
jgi:hypothetical protein